MSVEPAIPQHLRCPRTQASRMPAGFEAPYPAWMARFDEGAPPLVMACFGAQHPSSFPPAALAPIKAMLATQPAPPHWIEAQCRDAADYDTRIIIAYWQDSSSFNAWRHASGFEAWGTDPARESGPLGRFMEVVA